MNKEQREQSLFFVDVNDDVDKVNNDVNKDGYEMYLTKVIWEEHVSLFFVMIVQQQKRMEKKLFNKSLCWYHHVALLAKQGRT